MATVHTCRVERGVSFSKTFAGGRSRTRQVPCTFGECRYLTVITMHAGCSLWGIQLVATGVQLGNSFFLTVLPMVLRERHMAATNSTQTEDGWRVSVSGFFVTYRVLSQLVPVLPGLLLAWLGDAGWRRSLVVVPLLGLLLSRLAMLLMLVLDWPLQVLWVEVVLTGLCGGSTVFCSGIMTLLSLSSAGQDRSKLLMRVELISGLSGVVGCMTAGHLYDVCGPTLRPGVLILMLCLLLHALCLFYILLFLQVGEWHDKELEPTLNRSSPSTRPHKVVDIALLWVAGMVYNAVDSSTRNILVLFQLMDPLHWNVTQVGYGNASGFLVTLSSFLSTVILSRWFNDRTLITLGLVSNAAGMLLMAFVTTTYTFFLARALTLFSLMPVALISSLLSQQVHVSSYSKVLTLLQLSLKVSSAGSNLLYAKIYQQTFTWFPGLVLIVSSILSIVAIVPIRIFDSRLTAGCRYRVLAEEDDVLVLTEDPGENQVLREECESCVSSGKTPECE
ncbi:solute carrier family 46 member 2 isoform X1 [Nerophis ophidion]|uniref:solute carrier family 46 member 2 isoform X1 n=1 Tax=Nerophis ophidion TaxID=159077 RepID=UPI002AE0269A|nr:solute carrier family 46 member 2 isoform X1 [Nerophis ophidion]